MKYLGLLLLPIVACGSPKVRQPPPLPVAATPPPVVAATPAPVNLPELGPPPIMEKPSIRKEKEITWHPYGEGKVTVRCQMLRACAIELGKGESIKGMMVGDSERWTVDGSHAGSGPLQTPVITVKPEWPKIKTNILITTTKHVYDIDLVEGGKPEPRIGFWFPAEEHQQRLQQYAAQVKQRQEVMASTRVEEPPPRNENYTVSGDFAWMVSKTWDDGERTYIELAPEAKMTTLPAVYNTGGGKMELVNSVLRDRTIVIGQLLDEAALVVGAGRQAERTEIRRVQ